MSDMADLSKHGLIEAPDGSWHNLPAGTVFPPVRTKGTDGRCIGGCESKERAFQRYNPTTWFDFADSASFTCWSCERWVCVACGTSPAEGSLRICDECNTRELADHHLN